MVHVYVVSAFSKDNKGGNKAGVVLNLLVDMDIWCVKRI